MTVRSSGGTLLKLFGWFDPSSSSWKTSLRSGRKTVGWTSLPQTWPRSGMTCDGYAFELPTWEPPTPVTGGSRSHDRPDLFGTPLTSSGTGPGKLDNPKNRTRLETQVQLFRSPLATDGSKGGPNQRDSSGGLMLSGQVASLFKTPTASLGSNGGAQPPSKRKAGGHGPTLDDEVSFMSGPWLSECGKDYEPAVRRWEEVTGVTAPSPTEPGTKTNRRLSARFSEWMMGHVPGWITDTPGLSRTEQHTVIGGGVVQRQAEDAFLFILTNWPDIPAQKEGHHG